MALTTIDYTDPDLDFSSDEEEVNNDRPIIIPKSLKWLNEEDSSEDEFVNDMEKELDVTVKRSSAAEFLDCTLKGQIACKNEENNKGENKSYDDVYFDSDEEATGDDAGCSNGVKRVSRRKMTNDELFYDPDMDADDERWVERKRKRYLPKEQSSSNVAKPPSSDAVLNCPACFSLLCLDCQRHAIYNTQYRAMFVMNCRTDYSQKLHFVPSAKERSKARRERKKAEEEGKDIHEDSEELYHPVQCTTCNTRVAVFDCGEVYHFFNVLASH